MSDCHCTDLVRSFAWKIKGYLAVFLKFHCKISYSHPPVICV